MNRPAIGTTDVHIPAADGHAMTDTAAKTAYQAELFRNRLIKRYRHLKKWAKRENIFSYRIYDRDIPEIPLAVDLYAEYVPESGLPGRIFVHMALYERPYEKDDEEETVWLAGMKQAAADATGVPAERVLVKTRKRQKGEAQYEKNPHADYAADTEFVTCEQNALFRVNLSSYIDTGLFFDHRPLRARIRSLCEKRHVLNLFCYTGAFSVYAAQGKAATVTSVDLSKTYLAWAADNMQLNGFAPGSTYRMLQSDVLTFLREAAGKAAAGAWDIIILDPPTFSNSRRTDTMLDINRDWPVLCNFCLDVLAPGGTLFFSTNSRKLVFSAELLLAGRPDAGSISVTDITAETIPEDFRNAKIHRCWSVSRKVQISDA